MPSSGSDRWSIRSSPHGAGGAAARAGGGRSRTARSEQERAHGASGRSALAIEGRRRGCGRAAGCGRTRCGARAAAPDTSQVPESLPVFLSPLISLAALGLIVLICRWVFSTGNRRAPAQRNPTGDPGLLSPVADVRTRADADMLRDLLREAGVRAGVSETQRHPGPGVQQGPRAGPRARLRE